MIELGNVGLKAKQQKEIKVYYESEEVGVFTTEIIVENGYRRTENDKTPDTSP